MAMMAFIKNVRFAVRNLPSVVSNLKLEISGLNRFGDIFHGPEFLHGIPLLIFMALLIGGAFLAILRTLRKYKLKPYQTAVLGLILSISAWPLIIIQFTCGCILQDLLYWSMHFIYAYFDVTCGVPQYIHLYWETPRPVSCLLRPEHLGFAISLSVLFLAYYFGYGTLVATFCMHTAIRLTTLTVQCARKFCSVGMTVVYWTLTYALCRVRDAMSGVGKRFTNPCLASRFLQIKNQRIFPSRFYKSNDQDNVGEVDADQDSCEPALPCDVDIRACEQEEASSENSASSDQDTVMSSEGTATCDHGIDTCVQDAYTTCTQYIATCTQYLSTCKPDTATWKQETESCKVEEHESPGAMSVRSTSSQDSDKTSQDSDKTSQDSDKTSQDVNVRHLSTHLINFKGCDQDTKNEEDLISWESGDSDETKVYDLCAWLDEKESMPEFPAVGEIDLYAFM